MTTLVREDMEIEEALFLTKQELKAIRLCLERYDLGGLAYHSAIDKVDDLLLKEEKCASRPDR